MSFATRVSAAVAAVLILPAAASAALTVSHLASDADLFALSPTYAFIAEGRIGDGAGAATFELDLGPDTGAPAVTAQYGWVSAAVEPFTLVYSPGLGLVTFTLGGKTLVYAPLLGFTDVFVRTRAVEAGTAVTVTDLVLDGVAVADLSSAVGADGLDILRIQGGVLADGFTLTGNAVLSWTGARPSQSRLAFQIKVGDVRPTPALPATWGSVKDAYR
jgi:hypothetical protein